MIPAFLFGFKTDVVENPRIEAFPRDTDLILQQKNPRTERYDPLIGGISVGHETITAGTLGDFAYGKKKGDPTGPLGASNFHVLTTGTNLDQPGERELQPGPADGGKIATDLGGHLLRYVPLKFGQISPCPTHRLARAIGRNYIPILQEENEVDGAVMVPYERKVKPEIIDVGPITGTQDWQGKEDKIGRMLMKSGRTTQTTRDGPLTYVDWAGNINYGNNKIAYFVNQLVVRKAGWLAGGDSGSTSEMQEAPWIAIGRCFAGGGDLAIMNPIEKVLRALEVSYV